MTDTSKIYDVVVIGAGAMGLAAAFYAARAGAEVRLLEASPVAGGMAAHFDFDGVSLERFYHFCCITDYDTFSVLKDLDMEDSIVWKNTKMGHYTDGQLHEWGNPIALLKYPGLTFVEKFRYGLMAFWCTKRKNWGNAENMTAPDWFKAWLGESCYNKMFKRLFDQKLYEYTESVSATWIATRIQRIGRSRQSLMKEKLGHIAGGTQTLVDALYKSIETHHGEISLSSPVAKVSPDKNGLKRIEMTSGDVIFAQEVISTVPTPLVPDMIPDLTEDERNKLAAIPNIGVVCLVYKLKKPVTGKFWVNIIDEKHAIPGLIEFSALRDFGDDHIVYAPYYMPVTNERWAWSNEALLDEAFEAIKSVNPSITIDDVVSRQASRLTHSQPICTPNFLEKLPDIETSIDGLQVADTCYYYPEDRGISESVGIGKRMANTALERLRQTAGLAKLTETKT